KSIKMSSEIDYNSLLISIQTNLYKYGGPILMILGTVSCVLNLIVFTKKNLRKNPCAIYLVAYNIGNLLQIYTTMLLAILSIGYNIDPTLYSLSFCHFRYYTLLLSTILSPTYLILASIDRILITSPNALTRQRSTLRLTYISIIGVTLFWLLVHIHALFLTHIIEPLPNIIICSFQPGFYVTFINYYIILIQDILIPLLMITLGVWTVRNLRKRRQIILITVSTAIVAVRPTHSKDSQLIHVLIIDISIYIIFSALMPPALMYLQIVQTQSSSFAELELATLLMTVAIFSSYIPFCVGFYTNFLVSKKFRFELDGIYIFSDIEILQEEWTTKWQKIKSVHSNIGDFCRALQSGIKTYNQDSIAMSFFTVNEMDSTYNLNQLEPTFMYTQIFKDILLDMEHDEQAIKQFTSYCRQNKSGSEKNIDQFEKHYDTQSAIWWYTYPSFIYSMLNDGLRTMNADIIINMGFFLRDVHEQIQQLYEQQVSTYERESFVVYRGQGLLKSDFEKLQKIQGGLMSFNNFLSTSRHKEVSIGYACIASTIPDKIGILFVMLIDPSIKSAPFASIKDKSYFKEENEILFSMHTVFRVSAIKAIGINNQLYQVELQLTSDDDQQLRLLTDRMREEVRGIGLQRLGGLLVKVGQFDKAEELYNILLEQPSNKGQKHLYYNQLGYVKDHQADYEKAIWYYEQDLQICEKILPSNHPHFGISYNNIGCAYDKMGEYSKAISFYEKALQIQQKTLP
ncbi:unnamed protein product, partial [Adineta steineri]